MGTALLTFGIPLGEEASMRVEEDLIKEDAWDLDSWFNHQVKIPLHPFRLTPYGRLSTPLYIIEHRESQFISAHAETPIATPLRDFSVDFATLHEALNRFFTLYEARWTPPGWVLCAVTL